MKIATWSIVNNEIDFISEIVDCHSTWVDFMYILDTGSTDGTLEYLKEKAKTTPNLIVEEYHIKYFPEYEIPWENMRNPFPEVDVRNHAIKRCKLLCNSDWIIQLDGDEIFLPLVKDVILANNNAVALNHSTLNPTGKSFRIERRFNFNFYDPHSRVWNNKYNIEYIKNQKMGEKQFHCIPTIKGFNRHLFETKGTVWVQENFHIHLHWLYGKKMEAFLLKSENLSKENYVNRMPLNEFAKLLPESLLAKRKTWEEEMVGPQKLTT